MKDSETVGSKDRNCVNCTQSEMTNHRSSSGRNLPKTQQTKPQFVNRGGKHGYNNRVWNANKQAENSKQENKSSSVQFDQKRGFRILELLRERTGATCKWTFVDGKPVFHAKSEPPSNPIARINFVDRVVMVEDGTLLDERQNARKRHGQKALDENTQNAMLLAPKMIKVSSLWSNEDDLLTYQRISSYDETQDMECSYCKKPFIPFMNEKLQAEMLHLFSDRELQRYLYVNGGDRNDPFLATLTDEDGSQYTVPQNATNGFPIEKFVPAPTLGTCIHCNVGEPVTPMQLGSYQIDANQPPTEKRPVYATIWVPLKKPWVRQVTVAEERIHARSSMGMRAKHALEMQRYREYAREHPINKPFPYPEEFAEFEMKFPMGAPSKQAELDHLQEFADYMMIGKENFKRNEYCLYEKPESVYRYKRMELVHTRPDCQEVDPIGRRNEDIQFDCMSECSPKRLHRYSGKQVREFHHERKERAKVARQVRVPLSST